MQLDNHILQLLDEKFKSIEVESQKNIVIPTNHFLVIRLDAFHATKKHLKDSIVNKEYRNNFSNAINMTVRGLNTFLKSKLLDTFVCAFSVNDEVSIVLNSALEETAERRLCKICTLLCSTLSVNFTPLGTKKEKMIFDARPLLLESMDDLHAYLEYRYLLSIRYGYWKVLRLKHNRFPEIDVNQDSIKYNLDNAKDLVIQYGLENDFDQFAKSLIFHYPTYTDNQRKIAQSNFEIITYQNLLL